MNIIVIMLRFNRAVNNMKNNTKDVINTLQIIYNSTFMPIHLFENGKCISSMPVSELPEDFIITVEGLDGGDEDAEEESI